MRALGSILITVTTKKNSPQNPRLRVSSLPWSPRLVVLSHFSGIKCILCAPLGEERTLKAKQAFGFPELPHPSLTLMSLLCVLPFNTFSGLLLNPGTWKWSSIFTPGRSIFGIPCQRIKPQMIGRNFPSWEDATPLWHTLPWAVLPGMFGQLALATAAWCPLWVDSRTKPVPSDFLLSNLNESPENFWQLDVKRELGIFYLT